MSDLEEKIFIELLRSYHEGVNVTHGAQPQKEVAHYLAKEAYFMALAYKRTMEELKSN